MKKAFCLFLIIAALVNMISCAGEKQFLKDDDLTFIPTYVYCGQSKTATTVDFSLFAFVKKNVNIDTTKLQIMADLPMCKYDILKNNNEDKQNDIITINITVDSSEIEGVHDFETIKIILDGEEKTYNFGKLIIDKRFYGENLFDTNINDRLIDLNTQYAQTTDKSSYPYDLSLSRDVTVQKIFYMDDNGNDINSDVKSSTISGIIPVQNDYLISEISAIVQIEKHNKIEYVFLPVVYCGLLNSINDDAYQESLQYNQEHQ